MDKLTECSFSSSSVGNVCVDPPLKQVVEAPRPVNLSDRGANAVLVSNDFLHKTLVHAMALTAPNKVESIVLDPAHLVVCSLQPNPYLSLLNCRKAQQQTQIPKLRRLYDANS